MNDIISNFLKDFGLLETKLKWINPQLLNNDRLHYQRFIIEAKVQYWQNHEGTMPLILVAMQDNVYYIINGQHHAEGALRRRDKELLCAVFESPHWKYEKLIFDIFQKWQKENTNE